MPPIPLRTDLVGEDHIFVQRIFSTAPHRTVASAQPSTAAARRGMAHRTLPSLRLPKSAGVSACVDCCEAAAAAALTAPVEVAQSNGDVRSPWLPVVVETFAAFLHRMQSDSPLLSQAVSLSGNQAARVTPRSPVRDNVVDGGQPSLTVPAPPLPLLSPTDSAFRSMSSPPSALTPPPYMEISTPQAAFGAGSFTSVQDLIAHVRLQLRWTVVAARRRRRVIGDDDELADDLASSSLSSPTLPMTAAWGCPLSVNSSSLSHALQCGAPSTGSAATTCDSHFADGEVALVSDRVNAVLPTWAYLSSHIADATLATLVISAPTGALARGESLTVASTGGSLHRGSHNRNSSMGSSIVGGVPEPLSLMAVAPAIVDERVDRESYLYPYGLAGACALGRQRRLTSKTATGAASALSSLHLLRLELQVDVEHVSPAARNAGPAERQRMLDEALAEFSLTGVLPTTVLRAILNDAALQLLARVDAQVLRRVAGEAYLGTQADIDPQDGCALGGSTVPMVTAQFRRRCVTPLSLHVHTLQGKARAPATVSTAGQPLPSISARSETTSIDCGETDSRCHMLMEPTTTPTRLILTMLLHVQQASATFAASEAREVSATHEDQKSQVNGQEGEEAPETAETVPSSSAADATARMDDTAAVSLASAIVPHLFPLTFGLSRFTRKLSLSSAVDYDALCTEDAVGNAGSSSSSAVEAMAEVVAAASAGISDVRAAEFGEDATTSATEEGTRSTGEGVGTQPLTWQDISVSAVRTLCNLPELKVLPTPALMMPCSSPSTFLHAVRSMTAGEDGAVGMTTSLTQQPTLKRRGLSKRMVSEAAAASVPANETVSDAATDQGVGRECRAKSPFAEETKEKAEIGDGGAESVRRWDVDKETEALRSVVEAVNCRVGAICGQARLLWTLMATGESETEAGEADGGDGSNGAVSYCSADSGEEQQEARGGWRSTVVLAATNCPSRTNTAHRCRRAGNHAYLQRVTEAAQQVLACGQTLLITTSLSVSEPPKRSDAFFTAERVAAGDAERRRADGRTAIVSTPASAEDSSDSAVVHECGMVRELKRRFSVYDRCLSAYLCAPLEQLQALMAETIGRADTTPRTAKAAPIIFRDGNGSRGHGASTTRRVVPGSQTVVRETRRHRRHAAAVKASQGDAKRDGAEMDEEADGYAGDSPVLPVLSIARATVQLCRTMAGTSAPPHDAVAVASFEALSSRQHTPTTTAGGGVHPLRERVAYLVDAITSVLRLLEVEERRWAALQESVAGLKGRWCDMWAIINEERVQRYEMSQSSLVALREMRSTPVMEQELGFSSTEVEGLTDAVAVSATANAGPAATALVAESGSASTKTVELDELTVTASESGAFSERGAAQQATRAQSLDMPQSEVVIAKESTEERSAAGAGDCLRVAAEKALLSPSLPAPSRASRVEQEESEAKKEEELQDAPVEKVAIVEDSEAGKSGGDDGIEASVEKLPDQFVAFVEAATPSPRPLLSAAASSRLSTTPTPTQMPQRNQPKQNGRAKGSRRAQTTQSQSQAQPRSKATASRAQASQNGSAPLASLSNAIALTAVSSSSVRPPQESGAAADADTGAGAAAPVEGRLALALRKLQPLYADEVVLRQATPFVAIGAVLFLLLLLL